MEHSWSVPRVRQFLWQILNKGNLSQSGWSTKTLGAIGAASKFKVTMFAKVVSQSCILKLSQKQRRHLELFEIQSHHVCQRVLLWLVVCTVRLGENTHWRCLIPLFVFFYPNYLKIHVWWRVFWWLVVCSLGQKREGLPWIHIRQQVSTCACTNQPFYPPVGASYYYLLVLQSPCRTYNDAAKVKRGKKS